MSSHIVLTFSQCSRKAYQQTHHLRGPEVGEFDGFDAGGYGGGEKLVKKLSKSCQKVEKVSKV